MDRLFKWDHAVMIHSLFRFFLILPFLVPLSGSSQSDSIDSLKNLLSNKSGTEFTDITYELAIKFMQNGNYDSANKYCDTLISLGNSNNDSLQFVRGQAIKASVLRRSGFIDSAMKQYNQVLPIARRNSYSIEAMNILNSLGILYTYDARYDLALDCHLESLELRNKNGSKFEIGIALHNIGYLYYKLMDFDKALAFFTKTLQIKKEISDTFDLDQVLINISLCHTNMGRFDLAQKTIDEAFSLCNKACPDKFLMSAFFVSAHISNAKNNYDSAEIYYLKSYRLAKKIGHMRYQFDNITALAEIYTQRSNLLLAENYLKEAESLITKDSKLNFELLEIYLQFAGLYRKTKSFEKLAFYQDKYITLRDSIFNEEVASNLMKAEAKFVEKENQAKIEEQNKIMALNNAIIYRQRIINVFMGVVVILVIVLAVVLARSNRRKHFVNKLLDQKVKERTKELELNRDALQRAWLERDALINKASNDIRSSIATIKGLVALGLRDIDHPNAPQYLHKLNSTSDCLASILSRIFYSNNIESSPDKINL